MDATEHEDLLRLLKVIAQEQRLVMISLLSEREQTVTELAGQFGIKEPTVSHHLKQLRDVGLVHSRMDGNQRFYRLNEKRLQTFRHYVGQMHEPITSAPEQEDYDNSWIEELDLSERDKQVVHNYTERGRLTQLPTKQRKWVAILTWVATFFDEHRLYSEPEVNEILQKLHPDYATLRRYLVSYNFMRREKDGRVYWVVTDEDENIAPEPL